MDTSKSRYSAYHIYVSARDLAKIGQLMLNKGKWKGKQLISEEWINKITSTVSSVEIVNERYNKNDKATVQLSYGYMWWLHENFYDRTDMQGAYSGTGWGGQFVTIIPQRKLVIAHMNKVSKPVLWGLTGGSTWWGMLNGGTDDSQYWKIVNMLLSDNKTN